MRTFMQDATRILDRLKADRDFDDLFGYAVYLACAIIERDKSERAYDRVLDRNVSDRKKTKIVREYFREIENEDDYTDEEKEFYAHFNDALEDE